MEFTTVNRILSKVHRELRGTSLNESDMIEWIGEALEFLKVPQVQDQAVVFMEVKNYETNLPRGFQMVLQIAKNNYWDKCEDKREAGIPCDTLSSLSPNTELPTEPYIDPCGNEVCYRPWFNMQMQYIPWTTSMHYKDNYTPVRLANSTFFKTMVCKEANQDIYQNCADEYTIVGTINKKLRFSFKEGYIAMSYIKSALDEETGFPLIPDQISFITAITYYIKWKIAEMKAWNGRQGFTSQSDRAERRWLKYARQAKNYAKMPKSLDDYENLLEQTHSIIPRQRRYFGYFGQLSKLGLEQYSFKNSIHG